MKQDNQIPRMLSDPVKFAPPSYGSVLAEVSDNHQTVNRIDFDEPIETDRRQVEIIESQGDAPAALFALHCYE